MKMMAVRQRLFVMCTTKERILTSPLQSCILRVRLAVTLTLTKQNFNILCSKTFILPAACFKLAGSHFAQGVEAEIDDILEENTQAIQPIADKANTPKSLRL